MNLSAAADEQTTSNVRERLLLTDRNGLERRFTQAVTAHRDAMFRLARSMLRHDWDAEDAVSDALEKAWVAVGKLRSWDSVRPWLLRITYRCCLTVQSRRQRELPRMPDALEALAGGQPDEIPMWMYLEQLPEKARVVMHLRHAEGLPIDDIARVLRLPRGTVSARLSRAHKALADMLRKEDEPDG